MPQSPYNYALDLLAARAYSAKELGRKLAQKGAEPDELQAVLERLTTAGLLDDSRYALAFARTKLLGPGASTRRIKQELSKKGVDAEVATNAIDQVVQDEAIDTRDVVLRAAKKKLATMGDLDPITLRRRLYGFLARRGYDLDEIQSVVREVLP